MTSILKRLDGRPILMCRISYNAINRMTPSSGSNSGRKRERKISTASSTTSTKSSKKHKRSSKDHNSDQENNMDIKPEATNLVHLPGYASNSSSAARNLMPPPVEKRPENHEEVSPQNSAFDNDEFQVRSTSDFIAS